MRWHHVSWLPGYLVSSEGDVYSEELARELKQHLSPYGYMTVAVRIDGVQKRLRVNRLVCEAFHGAPPSRNIREWQAAHENGDKLDNNEANLSWKTPVQNAADNIRLGTVRNQFTAGTWSGWDENTKSKIANSLIGTKASPETRVKLKAARVGAHRGPDGRFARR